MKKILMLTDLSEASRHALAYARSFLSDTVADFHLLCVHPPEPDGFYSPVGTMKMTGTACANQLRTIMAGLYREATTNWHTFRSSDCPGHLLELVEKSLALETYDLVVFGAKEDGTQELFGNSTTALTRQLKADVLVVPTGAQAQSVRRVVLATDFAALKNCKLLSSLREVVLFKGATLTLLNIDTPGKEATAMYQEMRIRKFLDPVVPTVTHVSAAETRLGLEVYLAGHSVDLLVVIPNDKDRVGSLTDSSDTQSGTYTLPVPLLTIYDDGGNDLPQRINVPAYADHVF